ncbi:FecR family protein [Sphingobacterium paucimobilis]|uniref:FecR protein domain-containing protein n=1 Tax=Sphingobacterium paucimobilis HER1398 TaxID=1346330 RepID=U2H8A4_9SPHI|nr:FecR domain-containing protein [Sphingobacterium paucimobilis]ERJ57951.1 hypothetical protein M472_04145 [Sphingobacterium paucimobilis HER1398]
MEKNHHIRALFNRYMRRRASEKETDELFDYFGNASENDLRQLIDDTLSDSGEDTSEASTIEQDILTRIDTRIHGHLAPVTIEEDTTPLFRKRLSIVRWAAAAAVFIVASWGLSQYWLSAPERDRNVNETSLLKADQEPGRSRAVLTLADGQLIELKESEEGITITGNEVKYKDGPSVAEVTSNTRLNTISIPRGGQYRITLADGTKVWLNAASTLRYPTAFPNKERIVELDGEGYFEVAKNPDKPFKVISKEQVVQVLGTHFNINTYADESNIKTTLLEGSVQVTSLHSQQSVKLSPGTQSVLTPQGVQIREIDTDAVMAWKNNDFIFRGQSLKTTMRQLARWYDVEIEYADNAPIHLKIGGNISRKNNLSSVLKAMESTHSVKFEFDGKTILVK